MAKLDLKEDQIMIFRNESKKEGEKTPDYRGAVLIAGAYYEIALWLNESTSGRTFLSGSVREITDEPQRPKNNKLPF
jgi:uncharacterized protein (DUF736 family)